MTERNPHPRRPTVSPRGWRAAATSRAPQPARAQPSSPVLAWLKRESVALLASSGAALAVLAQLAATMPLAPQLSMLLSRWQEITHSLWRPPFDLLGLGVHEHIVAALNVAVFMALLGVGGRVSAGLSGKPLAPIRLDRFFDDQTWPSLMVFAALCFIFLVGSGEEGPETLTIFGSQQIGKYAFALIVTGGYFAGDFIGHREFHLRLYRLAGIVAALAAANLAIVHLG